MSNVAIERAVESRLGRVMYAIQAGPRTARHYGYPMPPEAPPLDVIRYCGSLHYHTIIYSFRKTATRSPDPHAAQEVHRTGVPLSTPIPVGRTIARPARWASLGVLFGLLSAAAAMSHHT